MQEILEIMQMGSVADAGFVAKALGGRHFLTLHKKAPSSRSAAGEVNASAGLMDLAFRWNHETSETTRECILAEC